MVQSTATVFIPTALKLFQYGISLLLNEAWVDDVFKYKIESHLLKGKSPASLLQKALPNGLLLHLGKWVFEEYFIDTPPISTLEPEDQFLYVKDLLDLLSNSQLSPSESLLNLFLLVDDLEGLNDTAEFFDAAFTEEHYYARVSDTLEDVSSFYKGELRDLSGIYGTNFAERVFHDREMCEYISHCIAFLYDYHGLPYKENDDVVIKCISREAFPSWVKPTLLARERGHCAVCGVTFDELKCEPQIDHIIPLAGGGCNDLVNLQMLCEICNNRKSASIQKTASSIPEYLQWHKTMRKSQSSLSDE